MASYSRQMCLACKGGKMLCGEKQCPLLKKINLENTSEVKLSRDMYGPSNSIFVGHSNYPNIFVGPMSGLSPSSPENFDNPGSWYGLSFADIIHLRSQTLRGKQIRSIRESSRTIENLQELSLSVKPVFVESHYRNKPHKNLSFNAITQPVGASGDLTRFAITENTVIPGKVDKVISDDLTSTNQVEKLFDKKFDVYYLSNVLSSGTLGLSKNKKMVPTRWSITAIDDILAKSMIEKIRYYPQLSNIQLYSNTYLENHFEVLLLPGAWEFEMFEAWSANTFWTQGSDSSHVVAEYEPHKGRKQYAYNEGGGYYAGRFSVAEAMQSMKRQARAVVFREIYDSYVVPVGVWEVRENLRQAMSKKPQSFDTIKEALTEIENRLHILLKKFMKKSQILRQKRITEYF